MIYIFHPKPASSASSVLEMPVWWLNQSNYLHIQYNSFNAEWRSPTLFKTDLAELRVGVAFGFSCSEVKNYEFRAQNSISIPCGPFWQRCKNILCTWIIASMPIMDSDFFTCLTYIISSFSTSFIQKSPNLLGAKFVWDFHIGKGEND